MSEWLFRPETALDKALHLGFGGFVLAELLKNALSQITPSSETNFMLCLAFTLLLAVPVLIGTTSADSRLRLLFLTLAVAFAWMALLYFISWMHLVKLSAGYDAVTDLIGTLFFLVGWYIISEHESDKPSRTVDRVALVVLGLLVFVSGASKLLVDIKDGGAGDAGQAARLILNMCNGAIFLSLYGQVRRLLPPPDPVTHVFILLYGCAQIAAHGTSCLFSVPKPCTRSSFEWLVAITVAWLLLLGKIAFGTYLSYLYFNGRIADKPPVSASPLATARG
jgi:hypothetical protein